MWVCVAVSVNVCGSVCVSVCVSMSVCLRAPVRVHLSMLYECERVCEVCKCECV